MRTTLIIAAMVAVAACTGGDDTVVAQAQADVAKTLRDPSSAQFREVIVRRATTGAQIVCGEVNGRNGYGGYAGFQEFIWHSGNVEMPTGPDDLSFTRRRLELCT